MRLSPIPRLVAIAALLVLPLVALAQTYPAKPVRIIVPFAAGGPADIYARFVGQRLNEALGQSFIVENRVGAGAVIGTEAAAKSLPDGYTLLMMSNTHTANETLIPVRPYDLMRDFVAVAGVNIAPNVLVVHPSVAANSVRELVQLAKTQPFKLNYASSGNGTPYHIAGEQFRSLAAIEVVHVPYRGSSGARTDLLAGQVQYMFDAVPTMVQNIRAGKVRGLAVTGTKRSPLLPEVPTMQEAGIAGYESTIWLGLMAPAKTSTEIVTQLNAEINKVVGRADTRQDWAKQGAEPLIMTPAQFDRFVREDIVSQARIIKASGAKAD